VVDLANFLNAMGAKVSGAGSPDDYHHRRQKIARCGAQGHSRRIEAADVCIAAAATNGESRSMGARADHLRAVIDKLNEAGVAVERRGANLLVRAVAGSRRRT